MELPETPVRVLYIMGVPRSGSTIIDKILGNHNHIVSVGELINLPINGWCNNEYCSCGEHANSCSFWSKVQQEWMRNSEINNIQEYIKLQNTMDQLWNRFKSFSMPANLKDEFDAYANMTISLYRAIQNISNKSVIVDSSKNPLRAFILSMIPGIDLSIIHLVRDAGGVSWSKKKSFKKDEQAGVQVDFKSSPIWRTAINWCRINLRCNWVRKQLDSKCSIVVCYEDFIVNPEKSLSRIGQLIDEDFNKVIVSLQNDNLNAAGHIIAGNRLRMMPTIKLKIDNEWKTRLLLYERLYIWIISGWMLSRYKNYC